MVVKSRSPLEPIATVVTLLLGLTGFALAASAVATVVGTGSIMGLGQGIVFVDVTGLAGSDIQAMPWTPHDGVSTNTIGYRFFDANPDVGQRVWYTLTLLPGGVLFVGALLLAYRLIRGAERGGIYTEATIKRLRTLGWFLLSGALAKMVVEMVPANRLLATMVTDQVGWIGPVHWDIPWTVLLTAVGLLSLARILRIGAEMRDDLQGTV